MSDNDHDAVSQHIMNFVRTGIRTTTDELAAKALGPVVGPAVVELGSQAINALTDDKDE